MTKAKALFEKISSEWYQREMFRNYGGITIKRDARKRARGYSSANLKKFIEEYAEEIKDQPTISRQKRKSKYLSVLQDELASRK